MSICKEELSIQFWLRGNERLEDGDAFNLNDELSARLQMAESHVKYAETAAGIILF